MVNKKVNKKFIPFVAGIGCGIAISIVFCLGIALFFGELQGITRKSLVQNRMKNSDFFTLEDNFIPETPPLPDPDWKSKLNPQHIPATMQKELNLKRDIFVAFLGSSNSNLDLIALSLETWGKEFIKNGIEYSIYSPMEGERDLTKNIIKLQETRASDGVTTSMIYGALTDLCNERIDTHRVFILVGAQSYLNSSALIEFARTVDESRVSIIGNSEKMAESDRVYRNDVAEYCSINPGIVITRRAMQRVCPHIKTCNNEINHQGQQDVPSLNLARCFKSFLNSSCISNDKFYKFSDKEVATITSRSQFSDDFLLKELVSSSYTRSTSVLTNLIHMHHVERRLNITDIKNKQLLSVIDETDRTIASMEGTLDDRLILGKKGIKNKFEHSEVIPWNRFKVNMEGDYDVVYTVEDSMHVRPLIHTDLEMIKEIKAVAESHIKSEISPEVKQLSFGDILQRTVPGKAMEFKVQVKVSNDKFGSVTIRKHFEDLVEIKTTIVENSPITVVLPIQESSHDQFLSFMQMFEQSTLSSTNEIDKISLLLVVYPSDNGTASQPNSELKILRLLKSYKQKHKKLSLRWIDARSSHLGVSRVSGVISALPGLSKDRVVCSMRPLAELSPEFFHHVRANVVRGRQLYFPIPLQIYNSDKNNNKNFQLWRQDDFEIFCGFQGDLNIASEMGQNSKFTNGEMLYNKVIQADFDVFRAPQPSLVFRELLRDDDEILSEKSCTEDASELGWLERQQAQCIGRIRKYKFAGAGGSLDNSQ